jgi:predicted MPP superfamily phosphohydrolase
LAKAKWTESAKVLVGLLFLPIGLGTWAFWLEPASLSNHRHELSIPGWPAECDGFRVAVLADLHVGSPLNGLDKLREIVDLTLERQPDLILLAGDYVIHGVLGGRFVAPEDAAAELAALAAPAGVFAVLGNHDWWLDAQRVSSALEAVDIPVLEDRSLPIRQGRCEFSLAGVSDFWEGRHDVSAALEGVPDAESTILFTHNPDLFPEVPDRVTLTIAGHTHGGQVYLPGIGRPIVPSEFGERFAIGHVVESGRHLFVSPGLGTSILPVRFLVPPQISILDLRAGSEPIHPSVDQRNLEYPLRSKEEEDAEFLRGPMDRRTHQTL